MRDIITPDQNSYNLASYASVQNDTQAPEQRVNQQNLLPTAITNKFLSEAVSLSTFSQLSFVAVNNATTNVNCTLVDNNNRVILALPQISIFIGITDYSQATLQNQHPTQTVGFGSFPVYFNPFDYYQVEGNDQVARVSCRNNTGTDQQVLLVVRWKVFTVPTTQQNNTDAATS